MSNERDELARIIERDDLYNDTGCCDWIVADKAADAILAAGYRKPRTVTTAAELDALPVGSVVLDNEGDVWQHRGYAAYQWCNTTGGRNSGLDTSEFAADCLPATVLHEGEK